MDDLTNKLSELLNKPGSMEKLQSALSALGLDGNGGDDEPIEGDVEDSTPASSFDFQELLQTLAPAMGGNTKKGRSEPGSGLPDLSMLTKLAPVIVNFNRDDENTALLKALRPYLHAEREKRLDDTIQMMRLMKILPLLQDKGLF